MTEKVVLGQAQRILVDATSEIWHKISLWTHASDVEMPNGDPLNTYLVNMNDEMNEKLDNKYGSIPDVVTDINTLDAIPDLTYGRMRTVTTITDGKYTIPVNHYLYSYSGSHPSSIERFAVLIDTTDLSNIVMYIANHNIENKWTLTKIATQDQIDDLQAQINDLSTEFNNLNLFVQQSVGDIYNRYQILQDQMDWLEQQLAELQEQLNDLLNELRDFKKATNARLDKLEAIWNKMYGQIGSIFITHLTPSQFHPNDVFGGQWELVNGAYLNATRYTLPDIEYRKVDGVYDFSAMFRGSDEFTIGVQNLPPHWHGFGEVPDDRDRALHVRFKDENYWGTDFMEDRFLPKSLFGAEGSDTIRLATYGENFRSTFVINATSGILWQWNGTQSNDKDGNMKAAPIRYWPTYFDVHCWLRIA